MDHKVSVNGLLLGGGPARMSRLGFGAQPAGGVSFASLLEEIYIYIYSHHNEDYN